jgi:vacuolar-type H+-ATPase subunit E/Vma4
VADILTSIENELNSIKQQITSGTMTEKVRQQLIANRDKLETWYNNLLAKGGLISKEDEVDATQALVDAKRDSMEASAKRTKTVAAIILGISLTTIAVLLYLKHKKA